MANIRREFGDDLTLKNGNLGINTTTAQERIDVVGVVKGRDLNATGVSSLTAYEGFLRADNQIIEETNLEFGNGLKASLSGRLLLELVSQSRLVLWVLEQHQLVSELIPYKTILKPQT